MTLDYHSKEEKSTLLFFFNLFQKKPTYIHIKQNNLERQSFAIHTLHLPCTQIAAGISHLQIATNPQYNFQIICKFTQMLDLCVDNVVVTSNKLWLCPCPCFIKTKNGRFRWGNHSSHELVAFYTSHFEFIEKLWEQLSHHVHFLLSSLAVFFAKSSTNLMQL